MTSIDPTEPRPAELSRRIDEVGKRMDAGFRDVGIRLDRMPTNDILLAYLATRDQEMKTLGEDVKDLAASLGKETAERRASMEAEKAARTLQAKEDRDRAEQTRRFAMTFALSAVVAMLGLSAFIINLAGGPT
jgi:hypothetical protein